MSHKDMSHQLSTHGTMHSMRAS